MDYSSVDWSAYVSVDMKELMKVVWKGGKSAASLVSSLVE